MSLVPVHVQSPGGPRAGLVSGGAGFTAGSVATNEGVADRYGSRVYSKRGIAADWKRHQQSQTTLVCTYMRRALPPTDAIQLPATQECALTVVADSSRMDDPLMWGFLPLRYNFGLQNWTKRWGFGSHDICYQTRYIPSCLRCVVA